MVIRTKRHSGGIVMLDRVCPSHLMGLSRIGPSLVDCEAFSNNIHQAYPDTSGLDLRLSLLEQQCLQTRTGIQTHMKTRTYTKTETQIRCVYRAHGQAQIKSLRLAKTGAKTGQVEG